MLYLYFGDVIANAIIEMNKINGERKILISTAMKYGEAVVNKFIENGYFAKIKQINDKSICLFEEKYSNLFDSYTEMGEKGYCLKEDVCIEDLICAFRFDCYSEILDILTDKEIVNKTLNVNSNLEAMHGECLDVHFGKNFFYSYSGFFSNEVYDNRKIKLNYRKRNILAKRRNG